MDERALGPEDGPLLRARLHLRGGRRRLREGKTAAGIVTLADALSAALEWYAASPERRSRLAAPGDAAEPVGDRELYGRMVRAGILDGTFSIVAFDSLTEYALHHELPAFDYGPVLSGIEAVMKQMGILPFDEADLPPEDPATF
jgi:hypothetical protein